MTMRFPVLALMAALAAGCSQTSSPSTPPKEPGKDKTVAKADKPADKGNDAGWWCDEHGLPESVCDLCDSKYRAAEKAKGNWCEHDRVKSSCFKCNPGLKEKYAAEYKAKFGKEPPAAEDDEKKEEAKPKDKK